LGAQPRWDLVVAPFGLDLILDLLEGAFARRRDAQDVVPDVTTLERDRVVIDADIAVEGLRDDVETVRDAGHRLTVWHRAGAIDGIDGDGVEAEFPGRFNDAGATAALVFHLVAQFGHLGTGAFGRDFLLQVSGDAFIGRLDARLDGADLDQRHAELALHRLAHFARGKRKSRIGDFGIEDGGFSDRAEGDIGGAK